jgi:hypothetical protein
MMTSLTSGLPSRLTWIQSPRFPVAEPRWRVVIMRRSTDAQTPIVPFFGFSRAIGTCTPNVCTP